MADGVNTERQTQAGSGALRRAMLDLSIAIEAQAREAGVFTHGGLIGGRREEILREALRAHLPERFGVASGQIHDGEGGSSGELDIVIFDRFTAPTLLASADSRLLPVESVAAVISVKSNMTPAAIAQTFDIVATVQGMPRYVAQSESAVNAPGQPEPQAAGLARPAVFLYAYRGAQPATVSENLTRMVAERHGTRLPHGFAVHGSAYFFPVAGVRRVPVREVEHMTHYAHMNDGDGTFGHFFAHLHAVLVSTPQVGPNLSSYLRPGILALDAGAAARGRPAP